VEDLAHEALTKALVAMGEGRFVEPDRITVEHYIEHAWLPAIKGTVAPSTYANSQIILKRHITPHIGDIRLQKLTAARIITMYRDLSTAGHRASTEETPRGLAAKSVPRVHTMLNHALADAIEWRYISRNPVETKRTKPPKPKRSSDLHVWSARELQTFLAAVQGDRLFPLWRFVAMTGCRRGEAMGIDWSDVDLKTSVVTISRSRTIRGTTVPKTERSLRSIDLDPMTVSVLKTWRKAQLE
jgi:integrase